jgi:hypothetical protein
MAGMDCRVAVGCGTFFAVLVAVTVLVGPNLTGELLGIEVPAIDGLA